MSNRHKILLVDDSDNDVLLFERELRKMPVVDVVGRVSGGEEAIAYLAGTGQYADRLKYPWPNVVVLDLKMPNGDGFSVLEWMQGKSELPHVAVFANSDLALDRERATNLGVAIFQRKSFDHETIARFLYWLQQLCQMEGRKSGATVDE